jgi:hypothetical protein
MKSMLLFCTATLLAVPGIAAPPAAEIADSKQAQSTVSVAVEPQLSDGRLVIKVAAKNNSAAPVPFGPGSISISTVAGQPIALSPLPKLINDVRVASGEASEAPAGGAPTQGAYAMRQQPRGADGSGQMDVSGYSAGSSLSAAETTRWSKHLIDRKTADAQIAALRQAILQDTTIAPGQIAVGQIVSEKLKFKKGEDRTLHLVVHVAGDEHGFTLAAPSE